MTTPVLEAVITNRYVLTDAAVEFACVRRPSVSRKDTLPLSNCRDPNNNEMDLRLVTYEIQVFFKDPSCYDLDDDCIVGTSSAVLPMRT